MSHSRVCMLRVCAQCGANLLYLSSAVPAASLTTLKSLRITHILCVCEAGARFPDQFKYLVYPLPDSPTTNLLQVFARDGLNDHLRGLTCNLAGEQAACSGRMLVGC